MMLSNTSQKNAARLIGTPQRPRLNTPGSAFHLPLRRASRAQVTTIRNTTKKPPLPNAIRVPTAVAFKPRARPKLANSVLNTMAAKGTLRLSTRRNSFDAGRIESRAMPNTARPM
ncbi:hypothetical protein D3C73_1326180 [compost metagenome]